MDPPGSNDDETIYRDALEEQEEESSEVMNTVPEEEQQQQQEEVPEEQQQQQQQQQEEEVIASANDDDEDAMRTSISMARQTYQAYRNSGGAEVTMKGSISSTRAIVQVPSQATVQSNPPTVVSQQQVPLAISRNPIIATAIPVEANDPDPPVFIHSSSHALQQETANLPSDASPLSKHHDMVDRLVSERSFPRALAQRLVSCVQTQFVKHYWLVDNSGSMMTTDCVRMVPKDMMDVGASNAKKMYDTVRCSRWNELEGAILSHIDLASLLEIPTTFRLLKGNMGMQEFTINQVPDDVEAAKSIVRQSKPDGVTLLSKHLLEICHQIEQDQDVLLEKGQKAVVVIATDAIPSDQYGDASEEAKETFLDALKKLRLLPVWIVIRLCTNDRRTMAYYRRLDQQLEIPVECVSDYITESKEVRRYNPWLNYSPQLHQCREMGFYHRVFDLLDERALTKDDTMEFLTILFGAETFDSNVAPNIHNDWNDFLQYLKTQVLALCEKQYSPTSNKMEDLIDVNGLKMAHGLRGSIRNQFHKMTDG